MSFIIRFSHYMRVDAVDSKSVPVERPGQAKTKVPRNVTVGCVPTSARASPGKFVPVRVRHTTDPCFGRTISSLLHRVSTETWNGGHPVDLLLFVPTLWTFRSGESWIIQACQRGPQRGDRDAVAVSGTVTEIDARCPLVA